MLPLTPGLSLLLLVLLVWTIPLKGIALWRAARKNHLNWFIALLIINTVGLLEAAYIFHFSEKKPKSKTKKEGK